jgi:hypothetical protein
MTMTLDEKNALKMAREDLCFSIDRFVEDYGSDKESPYVLRLAGTIGYITKILNDKDEFIKLLTFWDQKYLKQLI